jgi:hypothetical protein
MHLIAHNFYFYHQQLVFFSSSSYSLIDGIFDYDYFTEDVTTESRTSVCSTASILERIAASSFSKKRTFFNQAVI